MSKQDDFIKAPVFGISEDELATGSVNDNEVGTINAKKIKAHSITSDQIAAGAIGAVQLQAGAITAFKITVPNRVKGTTVVFSVGGTNNNTLQWTDGVAYLMKMKYTPGDTMGDLQVVQVQQTISAGSYQFKAGDNAYYFYVEWVKDQDSDEPADSATLEMKKSETYPDGDTAIVLAYAWYDDELGMAQFQALDTAGGGVRISGNSIIAGSVTAQNIRAGTITADRLAFQAFDKGKDTLDNISDGSMYKRVKSVAITADGMVLLDKVVTGEYGLVKSTDIQAGHILLSSVIQSSDFKTVTDAEKASWDSKESGIYRGKTPPDDTSRLWLDTGSTPNILKRWDGTQWVPLGALNLDQLPDGTTFRRVKAAALTPDGLVISDNIQIGSVYGMVKKSALTADGLVILSQVQGSLDDLKDGTQYSKVLKTDIQAGHIYIYSQTQFAPGYDPSTKIPVGGAAQDINNSGGLDAINDGVTYKKATATQLQGGGLAYSYITPDGKWATVFQSNAIWNPPSNQAGLYMTNQFMGYWNGTGWGVYIRSDGRMFLGSQYNNQYLYWDGNTLTVRGNVEANSITANISITSPYITLSSSGYIAGGKSYFADTNSGFWLGYYNGNYTFSIGNSSQYIKWDGSSLSVKGTIYVDNILSNVSISSPYISGGTISGGTITGTTITGSTFQTNEYAYTYIKIEGQPSYAPPQIQFYYMSQLYHYIQEGAGDLYIKTLNGNNIYIQANTSYSVYISPSLYVNNAVNIGTATSLSELYYNYNYYLTTSVGVMLPAGKGLKFNYIYQGGDLWFDSSANTFKYKDTNGNIKTIQAV